MSDGGPRPVTFLSDYGESDMFAGICRAVISRISPGSPIIDLTHGILPGAVGAGALSLAAALPYTAPGVHVAIVDPGVGTRRRAVAVEVAEDGRVLVGPDNGLLAPAVNRFGGATRVVEISNSPLRLEPVSPTFHGRDIFAPVAAAIAAGTPLDDVGVELPARSLIPLSRPRTAVEPDRIIAFVSAVDRFGNVRLDANTAVLGEAGFGPGDTIFVAAGNEEHEGIVGLTFADARAGRLVLYGSSMGLLAIATHRGSAAAALNVNPGSEIELRRR